MCVACVSISGMTCQKVSGSYDIIETSFWSVCTLLSLGESTWVKIDFPKILTASIIQLKKEFEFPAKSVFANNSMIIDLKLRF